MTKVIKEEKADKKRAKRVNWRMTNKERLAYYAGDTGRLFNSAIITYFMSIFLIFKGVNMTSVATVVLVVKIIDSFDDVIFGFFVDRFDPKKFKYLGKFAGEGKYLPWYRLTFFLYPIATILFFMMPSGLSQGGKIAWFAVFYLLYDFTCTLSEVPMNSMVMTLTDSVDERNNILKVKGVVMTIGAIFAGLIWQVLISEYVGLSVTSVAITSSIVFLLIMIPLATSVKEYNGGLKNVDETAKENVYTLKEMWNCVKTNKYIVVFFISTIVFSVLMTNMAMATFVSFYLYGNSILGSLPTLIAFIPGILLMTQADKIAKKMGKSKSIIFFTILSGAGYLVLYLVGYDQLWVCMALTTISCIPGALRTVLTTYIAPDTIEYTRYKTGQDCSGIFFSINSFVGKMTGSVASSVGMFILGACGWVTVEADNFADLAAQGVNQPESALQALWIINGLVPAIGCFLGAALLLLYRLKDSDAELMAQCNAGVITREECESRLSKKY